ncbi:hypothetical protein ABZ871_37540 [Streptomyces populi]
MQLSATRRGARLARLLAAELADRWGVRSGPVPCGTVWAELDLGPGR